MAFLQSGLETLAYNQAGWNAILNTDLQIIDERGVYKDTDGDVVLKGLNTSAKATIGVHELNIYLDEATGRICFRSKKTDLGIVFGYVPVSGLATLLPPKYMQGLNLLWLSATQIKISSGYCVDSANAENIEVSSEITVDSSVSGAGGLDTGAWGTNTLYHVFAIKNTSTSSVSGIFSLSSTSPTLPAGYTVFRRLGAVKSDISGNIMQFSHEMASSTKIMRYLDISYANILSSGVAIVWTDVFTNAFVPSTAKIIHICADSAPTSYYRKKGDAVTYSYRTNNGDTSSMVFRIGVDATGAFQYYKSGAGDINIDLIGYEEDL